MILFDRERKSKIKENTEIDKYENLIIIYEKENTELKDRLTKALHRIQLIQMWGEVEIKDLTELAGILMGDENVSSNDKN